MGGGGKAAPEEGPPHGALGAMGDGRELAWLPECVIGRWEAERGGPLGWEARPSDR